MLARLTRELPVGHFTYEPKWDGFRALAFAEDGEVDLRSRHGRPLARYFPELLGPLRALAAQYGAAALDGEIILAGRSGFDFPALMSRLHPAASRVERLSRETPAAYVAFDLLAVRDDDLRAVPFRERRSRLELVMSDAAPPLFMTPATRERETADYWFERHRGAGVDGIIAKPDGLLYEPGRRMMTKVKHERTADCIVAGLRLLAGPAVSSLLLALYAADGDLRHVGVVTQLPATERVRLLDELAPLVIPLADHPWRDGFGIGASPLGRLKGSAARWTPDMEHDWVPLRPSAVVEVGFDQVDVDRFRHPARLKRWRPDRIAESCTIDQIEVDAPDFGELLGLDPMAAAVTPGPP
jgi:ATP-dependent DNA ligase